MAISFAHHRLVRDQRLLDELAELRLNGEPLSGEPDFASTKHGDRFKYSRLQSELFVLLNAILPEGEVPKNVWQLEPSTLPGARTPDFRVEWRDGSRAFVECTRAGDPSVIKFESTFPDMGHALNRWLAESSDAQGALGNRYVAFVPQAAFAARDETVALEEMKRFVLTQRLGEYAAPYGKRAPEEFGKLSDARTLVLSNESDYPHLIVKVPAMATGGPREALHLALEALAGKQEAGYEGFRPIWLAIDTSSLHWPLSDVFAAIEKRVSSIAPFERVYFCNSNESFVIRDQANS